MGKKIDLVLLHLLTAAGGYLFYMGAFGNVPLALLLTFLTVAAAGKAVRCIAEKRKPGRRKRLARARSLIRQAARMPEEEGERRVWSVLERAYPDAAREKCVILLRAQPLGEDGLLSFWRSRAGEEALAVAATCDIPRATRALAEELISPRVRLFDGEQLARLLARQNLPEDAPAPRRRGHFRQAIAAGLERKRAGRNLLIGLSMLLLYRMNGRFLYFLSGLFLLGVGALSLLCPRLPEEFL